MFNRSMFNHRGHRGTQRSLMSTRKSLRAPLCPLWLMLFVFAASTLLISCRQQPAPNTLVMVIEFGPTNLDPRIGTDAQSEFIDELLFDSLVRKDHNFNLVPSVAERWEIPDPKTYVFHLRKGIHFHDGRPLTSRDVQWTLDTMRNGTLRTIKGASYKLVERVEPPDDYAWVVHLSEPFGPLLWNLSEGAFGIVPYGSGKDFNANPVGSGPFRFVRFDIDSQIVIERNDLYWGEHPRAERIRFAIVPDATTRALELRKGSADLAAANSFPLDMVRTLAREHNLVVQRHPGTSLAYLAFNFRDPILQDVRVRQAFALAIDRQTILHYLFSDSGRLAASVLPPEHWAYYADAARYPFDLDKANAMLDSAGY